MKKLEKVFIASVGFMIVGACMLDFYGRSFVAGLFLIGGGVLAAFSAVFSIIFRDEN